MLRCLPLLILFVSLSFAQAQEVASSADTLRVAQALERLSIRLDALTLAGEFETNGAGESDEEVEEGDEGEVSLESLFILFAGSLEEQDAALVAELEGVLEGLESSVEIERTEEVQRAQTLLNQARILLIPESARTPTFQAALLAHLLLQEGGVGESYEEAANGEMAAYSVAWAGLERTKTLWNDLEPELEVSETQSEQIDRAFGVLDDLIPSPEPPERFRDPEDAEGATSDIAFALEAATSETLFPRDLSQSVTQVQDQLEAACGAAQAGRTRKALEHAASAHLIYAEQLNDTLSILAPELNTDLQAHLAGPLPEHIEAGANVGADCGLLRHALTQVGERLR